MPSTGWWTLNQPLLNDGVPKCGLHNSIDRRIQGAVNCSQNDAEKQNLDKKIEGDDYAIRIRLNIRPQEILGSG